MDFWNQLSQVSCWSGASPGAHRVTRLAILKRSFKNPANLWLHSVDSLVHPTFILILAALALAVTTTRADEGWSDLFNGHDLSGWVSRGGQAKYGVEEGAIVGTTVLNVGNSFLCTEKTYGDFIFECDFKVDPRLNSGVQIRSECFDVPKEMSWQGKQFKIPAGRVHGYQVEIDPNVPGKRLWSAGIYDEARRGWLFPSDGVTGPQGMAFSEQGLRLFKPQDWNHLRVEAVGDSIKTWLNGTSCADIQDGLTPRGFIGLQVHMIRDDKSREGAQVRFRDLRIKEIASANAAPPNTLSEAEKAAGWRLLWDGRTTDGWRGARAETFPSNGWKIVDGVLTEHDGGGNGDADGGDIVTRERFSNFELVADFKITPGANSGIKYFVQSNLDHNNQTDAHPTVGYEFQILDDERHPDAKLGRDGNRKLGSLYDLLPASADKKVNAIGEWNTARIVVRGNHVEHWLNGQLILAYDRDSAAFRASLDQSKFKSIAGFGTWPDGHVLLQDHGNQVDYRNLKLRVLAAN